MRIFYLIGLVMVACISLILSVLGFAGKDIILDDEYIKASQEDREKMDTKAYRQQGAIIFLFIFAINISNLLWALLHKRIFTYITFAICGIGIIYAIVTHYAIKKKAK